MATFRYFLKKADKNGESLVYLRYGHKSETVVFSTETIKVNPDHWNEKKQLVNSTKGIKKNNTTEKLIQDLEKKDNLTNIQLHTFKNTIQLIVNKIKSEGGEPYVKTVKAEHEKGNGKIKTDDFFTLYDDFIKQMESERSEGTIKQYKVTRNNLLAFCGVENYKINIHKIDLDFYDKLKNYFTKKHILYTNRKRKENLIGMNTNTLGHNLKNLKTFLNYLVKRKAIKPVIDLKEDFKVPNHTKTIVYHSQEELEALYNYDFKNDRLNQARDIHVFLCSTGLRISDLLSLNQQHFTPSGIKKRTVKNKKDVYIPYTPKSRAILEKYNFKLPVISEQKLNEYIKEACKITELYNYSVEVIDHKKGRDIRKSVPKWQLISNHTAIKTFCTHASERGITAKVLSVIVGKSLQTIIKHYYGTSDQVIELEMQKAFGEANMKVS